MMPERSGCRQENESEGKTCKEVMARTAQKYESQERYLTDATATQRQTMTLFMRMKEDHMRNGQLKPDIIPRSVNRQFILNYTIHQCAGDTSTYPLHMDNFHSFTADTPICL